MAAVGTTVLLLLARFSLLSSRQFDPDELEHMHVAWYISQGYLPYRDFYEVHAPLFHYLLAQLLRVLDVGSADAAMEALFLVRKGTWFISVGIVACTFALARRLRDEYTAWLCMPILATDIILALRGVEIRPDGLAAICWLGCLVALDSALHKRPDSGATRATFAASGLCLGVGVLTSQKLLIAGPSLAVTAVWYVSSRRFGATPLVRITNVAWQACGFLVPWVLVLTYFAIHWSAYDFIDAIVLQGLSWQQENTAGNVLAFIFKFDPWLFALAGGGACVLLYQGVAEEAKRVTITLLLLNTAGVFLGLFMTPVPFPRSCLTFIPLFAVLAAAFLAHSARALASIEPRPRSSGRQAAWIVATVVFVVLAGIGLRASQPVLLNPLVYPVIVAVATLAVVLLPLYRRPALALCLVVVALAAYPAQWTRWMAEGGDRGQFAALRYVMANSTPDAVVMDGWTGYGVFRRHAWHYWMLQPGVRAMLPVEAIGRLEVDLESGRVRPDIVVLDENLRQVSKRVTDYLESHYQPTGIGAIYIPRTPRQAP